MPANKKYLSSPLQRLLKISAAVIGGYLVTTCFHLFLMTITGQKLVLHTMTFSVYLLWAVLMIVAFLSKNGWKIWGWYLFTALIFLSPYIYKMVI